MINFDEQDDAHSPKTPGPTPGRWPAADESLKVTRVVVGALMVVGTGLAYSVWQCPAGFVIGSAFLDKAAAALSWDNVPAAEVRVLHHAIMVNLGFTALAVAYALSVTAGVVRAAMKPRPDPRLWPLCFILATRAMVLLSVPSVALLHHAGPTWVQALDVTARCGVVGWLLLNVPDALAFMRSLLPAHLRAGGAKPPEAGEPDVDAE